MSCQETQLFLGQQAMCWGGVVLRWPRCAVRRLLLALFLPNFQLSETDSVPRFQVQVVGYRACVLLGPTHPGYRGRILHIGPTHFAPGEWIGVELETGKIWRENPRYAWIRIVVDFDSLSLFDFYQIMLR